MCLMMLFMVLPLLGGDYSPRLDLNIISPFQSQSAVGPMSRDRWMNKKSLYHFYSEKWEGWR